MLRVTSGYENHVMIDNTKYAEKFTLFEREYKRVEPYKTRRPLTTDLDLLKDYKESLVRTYNELIDTVDPQTFSEEERLEILSKFTSHLSKLRDAFKILKLNYKFEKGVFNTINVDLISEISDDSLLSIASTSGVDLNTSQQSTISTNNTSNRSTMTQSASEFIATAHRMINYRYAGDPLALDSFIDAVDLLNDLCEDQNKAIFLKYVMTRLEGLAREAIITAPANVDDVIRQLREGIKTESSKVIEGRILALRADRSSLTKFSEQAEKLAEQFKRSLCLEGFSRDKAKEIAIEKTVEMCRKSSKNDTVKAVLAASKFSEPKEVIAKMIVEINNLKQDKPNNSYAHKFGNNSNKNSGNPNGQQNNRGNGNGFHNNRNNNSNRNNSQNNRYNNNGHNGNGHRSNNNHNNRNSHNNYGNHNNRNNNGQYQNRSGNEQSVRVMTGNEEYPGNGGLQMNQ